MKDHWYVLAFASDVPKRKPRRFWLWSKPIVLWRDATGAVVAMADRCPHRDVPLSQGTIQHSCIVCPYHGWEFDQSGACTYAPTLGRGQSTPKHTTAYTLPVCEQDGFIWVWAGERAGATGKPPGLAAFRARGLRFYRCKKLFEAASIDLIENFIDAPHTPILHRGIVRGSHEPVARSVRVHCDAGSVTVEHAPSREHVGIAQRLINPHGEDITHTDSFQLPGLVQVTYRFGARGGTFVAFIFCTPISADKTLAHIMLGVEFQWASVLVRALLPLVAHIVLKQDFKLMQQQRDNLKHFHGRSHGFLEADLMHVQAQRLWRSALENTPPLATSQREIRFFV